MSAAPHSPATTVMASARDPAELEVVARDLAWRSEYFPSSRTFRTEVLGVSSSNAQLVRADFRTAAVGCGEAPRGAHVLVVNGHPEADASLGGEALDARHVGIVRPGEAYEFHTSGRADLLLLALRTGAIGSAAAERLCELADAPGSTLRLRGTRTSREIASDWSASLTSLHRASERRYDGGDGLEARLLPELLANLGPPGGDAPARRNAARRAARHIHRHWRGPLRTAELCEAARAPERTLRQGFVELFGCPPSTYIQGIRLRAARAALQRDNAGTRVSDVALACGFTHFGYFSAAYRRCFGETPSQTRGRARTGAACLGSPASL